MTRRESIQTLVIATSGTLFLAGCTEADAITFLKDGQLSFNDKHLQYLGSISEAILPTKHLGDKVSSPVKFIIKMVNECQSPEDILKFVTGFDQFKMLSKESKVKIKTQNENQILDLIKSQIDGTDIPEEVLFFINRMKSQSVRHLKNSQLYQENVMQYKLVPERYDGCIPA